MQKIWEIKNYAAILITDDPIYKKIIAESVEILKTKGYEEVEYRVVYNLVIMRMIIKCAKWEKKLMLRAAIADAESVFKEMLGKL